MVLAEVILLTRLPKNSPQFFSYFSSRELAAGSLICVPLGRRQERAIVIDTHEIKDYKMEIKKAGYELRPIIKILDPAPVLTAEQLKLAMWLGEYYLAPPGIFLKMMVGLAVAANSQRIQPDATRSAKQKLILVPTVTQIDAELDSHKSDDIAIVHSGIKSKQRQANWQKIASGQTETIIGTRLAVFSPFKNLKEIAVKDEANSSHRSWDMFPHYRTHEVARKLAELFGAKLTFESDIPSAENKMIKPIKPMDLSAIDMRQELRQGNFSIFSQLLKDKIRETLKNKKQIILFVNRRGLGTSVLCRDCGYIAKCQNCDASLAYHTQKDKNGLKPILICHRCGAKTDLPQTCPKCKSRRIKSFGIGTEKVEAEAEKNFKNASILRLDSDVADKSADQKKIIDRFQQKRVDILIGTQLLFSHQLPKASMVAAISIDALMHLPDFRTDEKILQTIFSLSCLVDHSEKNKKSPAKSQNDKKNNLLIQTYNPESKILVIAAKNDFETFFKNEMETRKILKYPPFSQIAKLTFRHKNPQIAGREAKILKAKLTQQLKQSKILSEIVYEISEAAPAFIAKEKNKYVWQIIIKFRSYWLEPAESREELLHLRNKILMLAPAEWEIEIDPESLL